MQSKDELSIGGDWAVFGVSQTVETPKIRRSSSTSRNVTKSLWFPSPTQFPLVCTVLAMNDRSTKERKKKKADLSRSNDGRTCGHTSCSLYSALSSEVAPLHRTHGTCGLAHCSSRGCQPQAATTHLHPLLLLLLLQEQFPLEGQSSQDLS